MRSLICLFVSAYAGAQLQSVSGFIHDPLGNPLAGVSVFWSGMEHSAVATDFQGFFELELTNSEGKTTELNLLHPDYSTLVIPIDFRLESTIDLGIWQLDPKSSDTDELPLVELNQLAVDFEGIAPSYGSFLQAQRSVFLQVAAFQFRDAYFKLRGLESSHQQIQFNGFSMQDFSRGYPSWNSWGGLNQFTNTAQEVVYGTTSDPRAFGGVLGSSQLWLRPSLLRSGFRVSQAASNALYRHRTLFSWVKHGADLDLGFHLGYRFGDSGYRDGTPYRAFSALATIEKQWNSRHSSQLTLVYTPQHRGKSAPLTQEVYELMGSRYNPYWGRYNSKVRNARMRAQKTPFVVFNHYWKPHQNLKIQFSLGYRWGLESNSRLYYDGTWPLGQTAVGGAQNPDPTYYQKMPSYALRDIFAPDYEGAYLKGRQLEQMPQLDWSSIWETNQQNPTAVYALTADQKKLEHWSLQAQTQWTLSPHLSAAQVTRVESFKHAYYNEVIDLLGADGIYDFDRYNPELPQTFNDVATGTEQKQEGNPFGYHYQIQGVKSSVLVQLDYRKTPCEMYAGFQGQWQRMNRLGIFRNGRFPNSSEGTGESLTDAAFGFKGGMSLLVFPGFQLQAHASYRKLPLWIDQAFIQARQRNLIHPDKRLPTYSSFQLGLEWRGLKSHLSLQAFGVQSAFERQQRFYFADGLGGDTSLFVQEFLSDMETRRLGIESSFQWEFIPDIFLEAVAVVGRYQYSNNPSVLLASEPSPEAETLGFEEGLGFLGKTQLKGYYLGGGPQQAYSISIKYQDPSYWTLQLYVNGFKERYLNPNPLSRTSNFFKDREGFVFPEYDAQEAQRLLAQEQLPDVLLMNLVFRKSWRMKNNYLGLFLGINNLTNQTYQSGGFEQGRNTNYLKLKEDRSRRLPLFGSKYWWSMGTTYFVSLNYSWN